VFRFGQRHRLNGSNTMATDRFVIPGSEIVPTGEIPLFTGSLVSIMIPCCGMLEYTKLCLPSVLKHSRQPFELIFLDIGSLDGTAEYLAGLAAAVPVRVEVLRAATDLDIKDACKEALVRARGEYVVLLNNDTVVTSAWLNQLIGLITMSPTIGAVGPMSNYAAPPQFVEAIPYRLRNLAGTRKAAATKNGRGATAKSLVDVDAVSRFAADFREKNRGKWLETERLGGFCLMIKREALFRIGSLDQWSDLGLFDTDILSSKTREAGHTLAVCRDLFIHHFGTRTFAHGAPKEEEKARNPVAASRS
jgi:GT2 family glycosyltransferase